MGRNRSPEGMGARPGREELIRPVPAAPHPPVPEYSGRGGRRGGLVGTRGPHRGVRARAGGAEGAEWCRVWVVSGVP